MTKKLSTLFFVLSFLLFPQEVSAQVVINEISASEEWVELYNTSDSEVSLEGCILLMGSASQDVNFGSSNVISSFGYEVAEKDVSAEWTSNWLNNGGDSVSLSCPSVGSDSTSYGSDVDPKTYGRSPNGGGAFMVLESSTKGGENSGPEPTPTPTLTDSPTPTPTDTPTDSPISTPTPTKSPTPKATVKAAATKKPRNTSKPKDDGGNGEEMVLGLREGLEEESPSPEPEEGEGGKVSVPAIILILMGVGFIGVAGYSFYVQKNKGYTKGNEENKESDNPEKIL